MLTSKEVLEKTGISRATLNNYISWGLVPRPHVLPPAPRDGAAPRIGYFPDEIVPRILEIQRMKRDGWSINRITEHFVGARAPAAAGEPLTGRSVARRTEPGRGTLPGLSMQEGKHPAYFVDDSFDVLWTSNAAAALPPYLPWLPADAVSHSLMKYLLGGDAAHAQPRNKILRFHLGIAKRRGAKFSDLCRGLGDGEMAGLQRLYEEAEPVDGPVAHTAIASTSAEGVPASASIYAVHFREGVLFLYMPAENGAASPALSPTGGVTAEVERKRMPALTEVAVLITDLQDSSVLWSELPAEEYFELINQIWLTVDPIFQRFGGTHGKHAGEGMVGYFFPQPGSSHLWNALLAAHQVREAIHRVSQEWQLRKGWSTELHLNTGIDEGREWLGTYRSGAQLEFIVLGDAVVHATRISEFARAGSIWVTRNVVGKLRPEERARLKYGVHRHKQDGQEAFIPATFSTVQSLADVNVGHPENLKSIGRLPIAEVIDIAPEKTGSVDRTGRDAT